MADPSAYPSSNGDPAHDSLEPGGPQPPRTPRWVQLLGIIALVLILAAAVQFIFGIRHGPDLHSSYDMAAELLAHLW